MNTSNTTDDGTISLNRYLQEVKINSQTPIDIKARQLAVQAHVNQTRWNGDAYITHPIRIAMRFEPNDVESKAVAYLHDVVEDTEITLDNLRHFGFPNEIIVAVDAITKRPNESYLDYILRCKKNKLACKVKKEDIKDNLSDLGIKRKSLKDKYLLALWILEH